MEKNPMNIKDPILEYSKAALLKNGTPVTIKGFVFDHSIFDVKTESAHSMTTIVNNDRVVIGIRFYGPAFSEDVLIAEVENICEDPDFYLAPYVKLQMNN